jgi:hypothetical protein
MDTEPYIVEYTKSAEVIEQDRIEGKKMRFRINKEEKYGWRSWFEPFGYNGRFTIRNELYLFKSDCSIQLTLRDNYEGTISFHLGIPFLISWYISIDSKFGYSDWWKKLLRLDSYMRQGRRFGIGWNFSYGCVDGGDITINLGSYVNEGRSSDPKWVSMSFCPKTFFCGKTKFEEHDVREVYKNVLIKGDADYPDKEYELVCKVQESKWSWPRFLKPLELTRTTVEVVDGSGIPHPGKGSCDYNCGESALYSSSTAESNPEKAFNAFVDQVYLYRKNYPL